MDDPTSHDRAPDDPPEGEHIQLSVQLDRTPLTLDLDDAALVRTWLLGVVDDRVSALGQMDDHIYLLEPGFVMAGALPTGLELGKESVLVQASRHLGGPTIRHRFRAREVLVPTEEGARRAVVVLQQHQEHDGWWCAWRRVGTNDQRLGVWLSEWQELEGAGHEQAPDWLGELVDGRKAEVSATQTDMNGAPPQVDVRMALLPPPQSLPEDPRAIAHAMHQGLDREIMTAGLPRTLIFVFRPDVLERWEVGKLRGVTLDEVVRTACHQSPALAVAVVHGCIVNMEDGRRLRGVATVVEHGGQMTRRILPLEQGPQGVRALSPVYSPPAPPPDSFLDRPPERDLGLAPIGFEDALGGDPLDEA
jgi:hypothetical protein